MVKYVFSLYKIMSFLSLVSNFFLLSLSLYLYIIGTILRTKNMIFFCKKFSK